MRASIIWVPHFGHSGHTIRVVGWGGGAYTGNPLISAAPSKISYRTRKEAVQYRSLTQPARLAIIATPCRSGSTIQAQYGERANTKKAPSHVAAGPSHGKRTLLRAHNRQHSDAPIHIRVISVTDHRHILPVRLWLGGCSFQLGRVACPNLIVAKPSLDHFDYWLVLVHDHQAEEPHWFAADNFAAVPATAFHVLRFSRF